MATTFISTPKCTCKWNHTRPTTNQNIPSCPHCKSTPLNKHTLNTKIKLVHTLHDPHFIQGIGMQCDKCNGPGWHYEKTYVETLPKRQQQQLNAIIVGASNGIDMDLLVQMRNGVSAAVLEKTSQSNLIRRHNALADDYKNRCAVANSKPLAFPQLDDTLVAKGHGIVRAFLRDYYLCVRTPLDATAGFKPSKT
jgi:hypothetical protein